MKSIQDGMKLVITCEHGGNTIPEKYQFLFQDSELKTRLQSHEGFDLGALELATTLAKGGDYFYFSVVSRLLIELNRSVHHPSLFSNISKRLGYQLKKELLEDFYFPYRKKVESTIESIFTCGLRVLHLSVHSFTPRFNGCTRLTDIGLLYDPKRDCEKRFAKTWRENIYSCGKGFRVRYNYPYAGKSDGFISYLRKKYTCPFYTGMELEVSQAITQSPADFNILKNVLLSTLQATRAEY